MMRTSTARTLLMAATVIVGFAGCRTFSPTPMEQVPFRERAQSQSRNGITVTVAVPSADEARANG
jgi:hypothetical protein